MKKPGYFRTNAWHQGDIIDDKSTIQALLKSLCGYKSSASQLPEFLVIITQDCDILHDKIEDEPYIDFLIGCFGVEKDGNLFHGKNPRRLQIEHDKGTISFIVHDILRVKKDVFIDNSPKHSSIILEKEDIRLIVKWISKRYARAAFPDEFNKRLKESKKIDKARENPLMDKVSLIFVDVTDEELITDQNYDIRMIIGVQHESYLETKSQVEDIFYDSFNIKGIESDVEVYDEYDITYEIISTYKRFDWDYRSLPENSNVTAPTEGIDEV